MKFADQPAFQRERLVEERAEDKRVVISVSLNKDEYRELQEDMEFLVQVKDSTALKQMWKLARVVIHDPLNMAIVQAIIRNAMNNRRSGIDDPIGEIAANVEQKIKGL